jgi:hypothetical protein
VETGGVCPASVLREGGPVAVGSELPRLSGYPFEVRYCEGALVRAWVGFSVCRRIARLSASAPFSSS